MMRVGLLGGAFDPPHLGHLICAQYTLEELRLDKIIFIPSGDHPFKRSDVVASAADRLAMTKLAVSQNPQFEVFDLELVRTGITYTIDTIEYFQREHADWEIYLLIGADNIADFQKWHRYEDVLKATNVIVFRRTTETAVNKKYNFILPPTPIIDISSTEIRQRIQKKKDFRYLVTREVYDYIVDKELYKQL